MRLENFYEEICRKYAPETCSWPLFNIPNPLFLYENYYETQKELGTNCLSLFRLSNMLWSFLSLVILSPNHLAIFDALIQICFSVVPKIKIGNSCKTFHDFITIPFINSSLNCKSLDKKDLNYKSRKPELCFIYEIKVIL